MLGTPDSVLTAGISRVTAGIDDLVTIYQFKNGPVVTSESSWCRAQWGASVAAMFEKATMEIHGVKVLVAKEGKKTEEIDCTGTNGYAGEIAYFCKCILSKKRPSVCYIESKRESIRIALAEEKSAFSGRKVSLKK